MFVRYDVVRFIFGECTENIFTAVDGGRRRYRRGLEFQFLLTVLTLRIKVRIKVKVRLLRFYISLQWWMIKGGREEDEGHWKKSVPDLSQNSKKKLEIQRKVNSPRKKSEVQENVVIQKKSE